jgi:hypothetical protein
MKTSFEAGSNFIWKNARLLERAIFEYKFFSGPSSRILDILSAYQNDDGGFGHALEPDVRCPESQPLFVEFALRTLYDCNLHNPEIAYRVCEFLSRHADLENGVSLVFPSSRQYPRAAHMDSQYTEQPSMERLVSLVGLSHWQGVSHPWLTQAVESCISFIGKTRFTDAHTILNAFCLVESLSYQHQVDYLFNKLAEDLMKAAFFNLDEQVKTYGLTPLTFAPIPDSYCRRIFTDTQLEAHLSELVEQQEPDGGWSIRWDPPGEMSRLEWRGYKTVMALSTLYAYGKL